MDVCRIVIQEVTVIFVGICVCLLATGRKDEVLNVGIDELCISNCLEKHAEPFGVSRGRQKSTQRSLVTWTLNFLFIQYVVSRL